MQQPDKTMLYVCYFIEYGLLTILSRYTVLKNEVRSNQLRLLIIYAARICHGTRSIGIHNPA